MQSALHVLLRRTAHQHGLRRPEGFGIWRATKVGVLGADVMGAGTAYVRARGGMRVDLKDVMALRTVGLPGGTNAPRVSG